MSWWSFVFASDLKAVGKGWHSAHIMGAPFQLRLGDHALVETPIDRLQHRGSGVSWSLRLCCQEFLENAFGSTQGADRTRRKCPADPGIGFVTGTEHCPWGARPGQAAVS